MRGQRSEGVKFASGRLNLHRIRAGSLHLEANASLRAKSRQKQPKIPGKLLKLRHPNSAVARHFPNRRVPDRAQPEKENNRADHAEKRDEKKKTELEKSRKEEETGSKLQKEPEPPFRSAKTLQKRQSPK